MWKEFSNNNLIKTSKVIKLQIPHPKTDMLVFSFDERINKRQSLWYLKGSHFSFFLQYVTAGGVQLLSFCNKFMSD